MLSVWIEFRLDMHTLKMRAEWSMPKQQQKQFNSFKLVNLVFLEAWC